MIVGNHTPWDNDGLPAPARPAPRGADARGVHWVEPELVAEVKYVPLPDNAYQMATQRLNEQKAGTIFGGKEAVGITIEELFQRELRN